MGRPVASGSTETTAERLLDAAELRFARHGVGATRLADIAEDVGIRRPSLLYHFASKDLLYAAVVRRSFGRLGAALVAAMARRCDFVERALGVVSTYAEFLDRNPAHARLLIREFLDADGPGSDLLLGEVVPLLDVVERFIRVEGHGHIEPTLPVRAAILQIASGTILRAAAGALRTPLWGAVDHARALARQLLLRREV